MNREDILRAVQSEKQETGEYERSVARKAVMYGSAVGVLLCIVMLALELWVFKKMDFGKPTILLVICGFADLYEGKMCKGKRLVIKGLAEMAIAVFFLLAYIGAFVV